MNILVELDAELKTSFHVFINYFHRRPGQISPVSLGGALFTGDVTTMRDDGRFTLAITEHAIWRSGKNLDFEFIQDNKSLIENLTRREATFTLSNDLELGKKASPLLFHPSFTNADEYLSYFIINGRDKVRYIGKAKERASLEKHVIFVDHDLINTSPTLPN